MSGGVGKARRAAATAVALLAACTSPTGADDAADGVRVAVDSQAIYVTNTGTRPVFDFVVGRDILARINWAACADVAQCAPIAPGATRATPRASLFAEPGEREAAVLWWHAGRRVDGVVQPDSIRAVVVALP